MSFKIHKVAIDNLYIADASVIPDAMKLTNHTTMIVAERVSEIVSKQFHDLIYSFKENNFLRFALYFNLMV